MNKTTVKRRYLYHSINRGHLPRWLTSRNLPVLLYLIYTAENATFGQYAGLVTNGSAFTLVLPRTRAPDSLASCFQVGACSTGQHAPFFGRWQQRLNSQHRRPLVAPAAASQPVKGYWESSDSSNSSELSQEVGGRGPDRTFRFQSEVVHGQLSRHWRLSPPALYPFFAKAKPPLGYLPTWGTCMVMAGFTFLPRVERVSEQAESFVGNAGYEIIHPFDQIRSQLQRTARTGAIGAYRCQLGARHYGRKSTMTEKQPAGRGVDPTRQRAQLPRLRQSAHS
jgi:hypothetical protein